MQRNPGAPILIRVGNDDPIGTDQHRGNLLCGAHTRLFDPELDGFLSGADLRFSDPEHGGLLCGADMHLSDPELGGLIDVGVGGPVAAVQIGDRPGQAQNAVKAPS